MLRRTLALFVALALASPALAGTVAVYSDPNFKNRQLRIEVADNGDARIIMPGDDDGYGILAGDAFYLVRRGRGGWKVIRDTDIAAAFDKVMPSVFGTLLTQAVPGANTGLTITKQGTRQVNGRTGTVYKVSGLSGNRNGLGSGQSAGEFVISDDPALTPANRGLGRLLETAFVVARPILEEKTLDMIGEIRQVFALGNLIDSPRLQLESLETIAIDPKHMALPAKPMTVDEIVADMKKSMPAKSE